MNRPGFTTSFLVDESPQQAFSAITHVRGWWSEEIEGGSARLGDEFLYRYKDSHRCKVRLIEVVPNEKLVWLILENYFDFIDDQTEWQDTQVVFELARKGERTEIRFTHQGLVPEYECYDVCSSAWSTYINGSLRSLITTGKGHPNAKQGSEASAE